jgi:predicted nucleotidyltransferase component of viral defense system
MLTRRQLSRISAKEGIALHTIERDYIQTLFLYELYKQNNDFRFKGGTCLRMAYQLNRYSEDLDFNYDFDQDIGKKILKDASTKLLDFGIESTMKTENKTSFGLSCKLRYKGPLYNGKDISKGTLKIDVSFRKEKVDTTTKILRPMYDDCPSFGLTCLTLDHILSEKIRAFIIRAKPRDLYDIWFLNESTNFDLSLINQKLKLYDKRFEEVDIDKLLINVKKDWKQDILPLIGFLPDIEKIILTVGPKLKELQK